jgi:hypothetical protein
VGSPFSNWNFCRPQPLQMAVVYVDQMSAVRAGMRREIRAKVRLYTGLFERIPRWRRGFTHNIHISASETLLPDYRGARRRKAGEVAALLGAGAHVALAPVGIRHFDARAAARVGVLAEVTVAEHAVQPQGASMPTSTVSGAFMVACLSGEESLMTGYARQRLSCGKCSFIMARAPSSSHTGHILEHGLYAEIDQSPAWCTPR